jgi:hypothetical protein
VEGPMKRYAAILWLTLALVPAMAQTPTPKAQCAGTTAAGHRCKRTVKPPHFFCYQHMPKSLNCTTDTDCVQKEAAAARQALADREAKAPAVKSEALKAWVTAQQQIAK